MPARQIGLREAIDALLQGSPPRAAAFIVTLYGDVVVPRGGNLWIGNVIDTCARAGINESLVRTSVSRLVGNGTLVGERQGRRSFYRLSASAAQEFDRAARRIYSAGGDGDETEWTFLQVPRECLRPAAGERLQKAGFAFVGAEMAVAPGHADSPAGLDCAQGGLTFRARLDGAASHHDLQRFAAQYWPLDELAAAYRHFIALATPLRGARAAGENAGPDALVARLLLVHEFRRVVLTDPGLPAAALGESWPGRQARQLFAAIYNACSKQADGWIAQNFVDAGGPLEPTGQILARRAAALAAMAEPA